ncbi:Pycsar system effector family protein [Siphonobacter sp.]|uniref:Pycsar system effector family protein n=1 Tax=Siphonobacter sp. TaxID=1869184 RepID=UPI003B3A4480
MTDPLVSKAEAHVLRLYDEHPTPTLAYHTLTHTQEVVQAAEALSRQYQLNDIQYQTVLVAAWFHDAGYLFSPKMQHEEKSAELATAFLQSEGQSAELIAQVEGCILATRMPQKPHNLLEEIICDADLSHLGSVDYKDKTKLLRKEIEAMKGIQISGNLWRMGNIEFIQSHQYFTPMARKMFDATKAENLRRLLDKQAEKTDVPTQPLVAEKKKKDPERGIETMFRTTSTNHLRLSEIADSKANIMISVNSIMVSVVVSVLSHRLENHPQLIPPTAIFLLTAVLTIIFAVLATRPNITRGTVSMDDIRQKKANLLFFGNFYNMTLEDYESGIDAMMKDSQFLYGSMTRDIYHLGVVLGKKYKLLRIAYNIFMFGFVVSILSYLIVFTFLED